MRSPRSLWDLSLMVTNKLVIIEYDLPREDGMPLSQRRRRPAVMDRYSRPLRICMISSSKSSSAARSRVSIGTIWTVNRTKSVADDWPAVSCFPKSWKWRLQIWIQYNFDTEVAW